MSVRRYKHRRPHFMILTHRVKTIKNPHALFRHIIVKGESPIREYYLHATKGWRSAQIPSEG